MGDALTWARLMRAANYLKALLPTQSSSPDNQPMSPRAAADYLNIDIGDIYCLLDEDALEYVEDGFDGRYPLAGSVRAYKRKREFGLLDGSPTRLVTDG